VNLVVTGGAGYVGSVAVPFLLSIGHRVRVLDSLRTGGEGLLGTCGHPRFEIIVGDVRDEEVVRRALAGADAIIHLAAIVGYPACCGEPMLAASINVEGTRTLLRSRLPDQKIVFASTGSIYGAVRDAVCTEETPQRPMTLYGETKAAAEGLVLEHGNAVSLRFATAFGVSPRMRFDLLLNDFTFQAVRSGKLSVYESGFRRTFVHVRDMARSLAFVLGHWDDLEGEVYNVGDETMNLTKAAVAERIGRQVPYDVTFTETGTDPDLRDYEVSFAKLRAKGFSTSIGLDAGIAELVFAAQLTSGLG
jgi:nucleoside-diphosphate-sugar epimerase